MNAVNPKRSITLKQGLLYCLAAWVGAMIGHLVMRGLGASTFIMLVAGGAAGALCGLIPYYVGRSRNPKLAVASVWASAAAGVVLGLLLAVPVALVFTFVFARRPAVSPR